jgi:hypothetical protein
MTTITTAGTLTASDLTNRILTYLLLPFGEPGRTSAGTVTASAGTLTLPTDPATMVANDEHDYKKPLGRFTSLEETAAGITASVKVAATRAGDDLLLEAAEGFKTGISVEIDSPVIRAGKLLAGKLAGAGFVVRPAFPSAQLTASDTGELAGEEVKDDDLETPEDDPAVPPVVPAEDGEESVLTEEEKAAAIAAAEEAKLSAAATPPAAPKNLLAHLADLAGKSKPAEAKKPVVTLDQMTAALFGMGGVTDPSLKAAAFDVITQTDMFDPTSVPQYLDELAQARTYRAVYSPLFSPAPLTGMEIEGWHIEKKPTVGVWDPAFSGVIPNETMNDIPTSEVTFKKETYTAKRIAAGNRFDRIHVDFPNPRAMSAFVREQDQAIVERLDILSKTQFLALAVEKEATGSDAADVWAKLIFGVAHALKFGLPDYAVIGNDIWRQLKNTAKIDAREFLAAELGLEEGSLNGFGIVPADIDDTAMDGRLFVGSKQACALHTPPGSVVRVDALELQKGALDKAVFGYYGFVPHYEAATKNGIVEVTTGI